MTCNRCEELSEALEDSRREADTLREALRLTREDLARNPVSIDIGDFDFSKYSIKYGGKPAGSMREQLKWDSLVSLGWGFARKRFGELTAQGPKKDQAG